LGGKRLPLYVEQDRDTEEDKKFKYRIRKYIEAIKSGTIQQRFGHRKVTVAFTVFENEKRLHQMRQWTLEELGNEPRDIGSVFAFANLPKKPDGKVWLDACWYMAYDKAPFALLAV